MVAAFAPRDLLLPLSCACAALSAIGGPMQDITTATLRQTSLPRADLAAAVRAFMVMNALGLLVTLLAAPGIIDRIGLATAIGACGVAILAFGTFGLLRFGRS